MTVDTILYDFNLAIGDTIQSWYNKENMQWPLIVSGIDSVSVNGSFRRKYFFHNYPIHRHLVESVGWSGELFGITEFATEIVLTCFNGYNDIMPWWLAFANECSFSLDCSIYVDIKEHVDENDINLYPNPFSDELNFSVNNNETSEIIIYNLTSQKILQQKFNKQISLNTQQLPNGFYYYEMYNRNGLIKTGKLVKK